MRIRGDSFVDLHLHSQANDGQWTADSLAAAAEGLGLRVIALTDHDTVRAVEETTCAAAKRGIQVIPGVELNVSWHGDLYHLLLYGIDAADASLRRLLGGVWQGHLARAAAGQAALERQGVSLPPAVVQSPDGEVLPILLVNGLIHAGFAADFQAALRLLGDPGILNSAAPLAEAVAVAHAQGALAVLAHPGRIEPPAPTVTPAVLREMLGEVALDGIEAHYGGYGAVETERYGRFAAENGLLVTCGSDSHGPRDRRPLVRWPARLCREFLIRCGLDFEA